MRWRSLGMIAAKSAQNPHAKGACGAPGLGFPGDLFCPCVMRRAPGDLSYKMVHTKTRRKEGRCRPFGGQSKIPMGLIETLRFALRNTADILAALAAATLRAAGNPRRKRQS